MLTQIYLPALAIAPTAQKSNSGLWRRDYSLASSLCICRTMTDHGRKVFLVIAVDSWCRVTLVTENEILLIVCGLAGRARFGAAVSDDQYKISSAWGMLTMIYTRSNAFPAVVTGAHICSIKGSQFKEDIARLLPFDKELYVFRAVLQESTHPSLSLFVTAVDF